MMFGTTPLLLEVDISSSPLACCVLCAGLNTVKNMFVHRRMGGIVATSLIRAALYATHHGQDVRSRWTLNDLFLRYLSVRSFEFSVPIVES